MNRPTVRPSTTSLPLIVVPHLGGESISEYISQHREEIDGALMKHGAILFRGFGVMGPPQLAEMVQHVSGPLMDYRDRATKRSKVGDQVFTSTEAPSHFHIQLHNENSFAPEWPLRVFFHCIIAAESGGRTPLSDMRKVFRDIDPVLRQRFEEHGVLYIRNFGTGPGMTWREGFQVATEAELERYCRQADMELEWTGTDRVRTLQKRPAVAVHPRTGEPVWFNHVAVLHASALDTALRDLLVRQNRERSLPHHAFFGDGSPIENSEIDHIREVLNRHTVKFDWEEGDMLVVDNMLVAHGREPFKGKRKVIVAMSEPTNWRESNRDRCAA